MNARTMKGAPLAVRLAALLAAAAAVFAMAVLAAPPAAFAADLQSATIDVPDSAMTGQELTFSVTYHFDYYPEDQSERQRVVTRAAVSVEGLGDVIDRSVYWDGSDYVRSETRKIPADTTETEFSIVALYNNKQFAHKSGQIIKCPHADKVIDLAIDPTCTEPGKTEGEHCSVCGLVLVAQEAIPAGHTPGEPVRENEGADGYDEVVYCTACEAELSRTHVDAEASGEPAATPAAATAAQPARASATPGTGDGLPAAPLAAAGALALAALAGCALRRKEE